MESLQALHTIEDPSYDWVGETNLNYECSYDPATNRTTVTFGASTFRYYGLTNYASDAAAVITVTPEDNADGAASANMEYSGSTNGGNSYKSAAITPMSVTVQHSNASGEKSVTIALDSTISCYITEAGKGDHEAQASKTVQTGIHAGYSLLVYTDGGATAEVNRTASDYGGTGVIKNGTELYEGDVLTITFTVKESYTLLAATLNNAGVSSGASHTVTGNVALVIVTGTEQEEEEAQALTGIPCVYLNGAWYRLGNEVTVKQEICSFVDFTNFEKGSFTEIVNGEPLTHTVSYDEKAGIMKIDGTTIKFPVSVEAAQ